MACSTRPNGPPSKAARADGAMVRGGWYEPFTFEQWVLFEEHSLHTPGTIRRRPRDGRSGLPPNTLGHVSATELPPPPPRLRLLKMARAEVTPPRESLSNWLRSSMGRYRHVGHAGGVCGLGRPSTAPTQVDGRSWERHFQRRDAKCATILINCDS